MLKLLSNATTQASLLIVVLSFYSWSLEKDIATLKAGRERLAEVSDANRRLAFRRPSGIAIDGKPVTPTSDQGTYIAFILRSESLQRDLDFWDRAGTIIH